MPRRSTIDKSLHSEEIRYLLIDQRWGSRTVARYIELKYGEVIPPSTYRTWRTRNVNAMRKLNKLPPGWDDPEPTDNTASAQVRRLLIADDALPDVVARRIALIQLQEKRIGIDVEHELAMGKLFTSGAKEIELLNRMYNDLRMDLQAWGLFPQPEGTSATTVNVHALASAGAQAASLPATGTDNGRTRTMGELMPGADAAEMKTLGRSLVLLRRGDDEPG